MRGVQRDHGKLEHDMGANLSVGCWSHQGCRSRTRLLRPPQLAASSQLARGSSKVEGASSAVSRTPSRASSAIGTNPRVDCSIFAAAFLGSSWIFVHAPWSAYDGRSPPQDTLAKVACHNSPYHRPRASLCSGCSRDCRSLGHIGPGEPSPGQECRERQSARWPVPGGKRRPAPLRRTWLRHAAGPSARKRQHDPGFRNQRSD